MQANQGFLGNFRTGTFFIRFYKKDKNDLPKIPRYTENFLFVCCCFLCSLCPQLILQFTEGVQWFYYRENYIYFSKESEGVQHFTGVVFSDFHNTQSGHRGTVGFSL